MAEKTLHNFQFPNALKWNTQGVHNRRRTPTTPSLSPIFHSTRLEHVPECAHAPFIGKVDVEVVKKTTKKEAKVKDVMTSEDEKIEAVITKELVDMDRREVEGNEKEENVTDFIGGIDEETVKSWNLRSRTNSGLKASGSAEKGEVKLVSTSNVKGFGSGSGGEKLRFTVPSAALMQTEIEEDYYAYGLKMPRRPKKRPKQVQNVLDRLFPGNNLTNISEERYYVSANSMKKQW